MAPTSIDGTEITGATIDGQDVSEITVDGETVFTAIPDSGVSRWEFEQDYTDSWGPNDGNPVGSPSFTTDFAVGSYAVNIGDGDRIEFGTNAFDTLYSGGEVSLSVWVKTSQSVSDSNVLFSIEGAWIIQLNAIDSGAPSCTFTGSSLDRIVGPNAVNDNSYHHLVAAHDGSDQVLYVDGNEAARSTESLFDVTTTERQTTIGGNHDGGLDSVGLFDDVRVYDKGLSSSEVSNLYNNGSIA